MVATDDARDGAPRGGRGAASNRPTVRAVQQMITAGCAKQPLPSQLVSSSSTQALLTAQPAPLTLIPPPAATAAAPSPPPLPRSRPALGSSLGRAPAQPAPSSGAPTERRQEPAAALSEAATGACTALGAKEPVPEPELAACTWPAAGLPGLAAAGAFMRRSPEPDQNSTCGRAGRCRGRVRAAGVQLAPARCACQGNGC
jgi:hypothetical protein